MLKKFNYKNHMQLQVAQIAKPHLIENSIIYTVIYYASDDEQCVKGVGNHSHIV